MKLSFNPFGIEKWFSGNIAPVLDLIVSADKMGLDSVSLAEHVVMGTRDLGDYPYAPNADERVKQFTERTDFFEPIVLLTQIGAMTQNIRLSTGVLLASLRPAALLAKQLATLDVLTGGRVDLSIGVGWQRTEYEATQIPWEGRYGRLFETARACKILWTQAPASFVGKHMSFNDIYCLPFPIQPGGPPLMVGVGPSDLNVERMAQWADGWTPLGLPLEVVAKTLSRIKTRMEEIGRDPTSFRLRLPPIPVINAGKLDIDATFAGIPELAHVGCTEVDIHISGFCNGPENFASVLKSYIAYAGA
ncbi:MAG TPA: TIGR03619 family F420-dependent LLM class oxidoreductase [Steroidobacteraceae bacterium]|jgi:probable F420-dependent oxidoreductase